MLTPFVANLTGAFVFLYLFWKKLKEDYAGDMIFTTSVYILIGLLLGFAASRFLEPSWWFWLVVFGVGLGTGAGIYRFHLRVFELTEALAFSLLPWMGLVFISDSIASSSLASFIGFAACGLLLALFIYLDRHYKNFSWYTSGRVGVSGLMVLAIFFSIRALVAIFFPFVLSFVGIYEPVVSGLAAFLFYFLVFNLAKKVA
jgi:hypothetical protein